MREKRKNNKRKDFIQVAMIITLLFLYAYYETKRKGEMTQHILPELVTPLLNMPNTAAIGGNYCQPLFHRQAESGLILMKNNISNHGINHPFLSYLK